MLRGPLPSGASRANGTLLSPKRLLLAVLGAALLAVALAALGAVRGHSASYGDCIPGSTWPAASTASGDRLVQLTNQHRTAMGLQPLRVSPHLSASAIWKARHMAWLGYLDHNDPAPPFQRYFAQRVAACGYVFGGTIAENIALGYGTADSTFAAWLASIGHRANIENPGKRVIGAAMAGVAGVQDFGTFDDSRVAGATTCGPASVTVSAPIAYGGDYAAPQVVAWRAIFAWSNGSAWQTAGIGPWFVSYASWDQPAGGWWNVTTGAFVGGAAQVSATQATKPPGGSWAVLQQFGWYTPALQLISWDTVQAVATGTNAAGTYCFWP